MKRVLTYAFLALTGFFVVAAFAPVQAGSFLTPAIFVVDGGRVEQFTNAGVFVNQFAINGSGRFPNGAAGMAIDVNGNFFLTDIGNKNVSEFNSNGIFVRTFGSYGSGNGQFLNGIGGIAVGVAGNVFVVDAGNHRVQEFSNTGTYLSKFGTFGSGPGQFQNPGAIVVNVNNVTLTPTSVTTDDAASGEIWVADGGRVEQFTNAGVFVNQFAINGGGRFPNGAAGMAIDAGGAFFLTDIANKDVSVFSSGGAFLRSFGSYGSSNGQFLNGIGGIAIGRVSGDVWVSDAGNYRVQKFFDNGTFLQAVGTFGSGPGQFQAPGAIAIRGNVTACSTTLPINFCDDVQ